MKVPSLGIRLLTTALMLLLAEDQKCCCAEEADAALRRIVPNRLQLFEYETIVCDCEGFDDFPKWRVMRRIMGVKTTCVPDWKASWGRCVIERAYQKDSGEYWCEAEGAARSNPVNITVTDGSVILESPPLPVMEGEAVTLRCRNKTASPILITDFYKDGAQRETAYDDHMIIRNVSKSDQGRYKCVTGTGESAESWLAVTGGSVILESPAVPVTEGDAVTLRCRTKMASSAHIADFYKDGLYVGSSFAGEMVIQGVSKSNEGLYKCSFSDFGESPESLLVVRGLYRETGASSDHYCDSYPLIRTVLTAAMVALLLLLVGQLHCGKLRVTQKYVCICKVCKGRCQTEQEKTEED